MDTIFRLRHLFKLSWPILISQLATMSMLLIDTIVVGHTTADELAAVSLGASWYIIIILSFTGISQATLPLVSHAVGAYQPHEATYMARQSLWLGLFLGIIGAILLWHPDPLLDWTGASPVLLNKTAYYLQILAIGIPAQILQKVLQFIANAIGHPRPLMMVSLCMPLVHLPLCWLLVYGYLGLPAQFHGAAGAALSEVIVHILVLFAFIAIFIKHKAFKAYPIFAKFSGPNLSKQWALWRLGIPIGAAYTIEHFSFTVIALLVAKLGMTPVSTHRMIFALASTLYMVPLSISIATAGMIGRALGGKKWQEAKQITILGIKVAIGLTTLLGLLMWFMREWLVTRMTSEVLVQQMSLQLMIYICTFQLFDATQTISGFALRAYKVTLVPLLIYLICFAGVGLGFGSWLAYGPYKLGLLGYWQGLVAATILASILLGGLLWWVLSVKTKMHHIS